jgi:phage terminase small subunit
MAKTNEEQKALFDKLKPLQKEISLNSLSGMNDIDSYKASKGKSKKEATMAASVSEILSNPNVVEFMQSMRELVLNDAIMSREEALTILSNNARVKVSDIATFSMMQVGEDEDDRPIFNTVWEMKNSCDIDPELMSCIKSVTMTKSGPKIELHDQQAAIKQISTMQGWDAPSKFDHSSKDGSMGGLSDLNVTVVRVKDK